MPVIKPINANAVKNDGGTMINAGNNDGSVITKTLDVAEVAKSNEVYGSQVVANAAVGDGTSDPAGVQKAKASGTLAYNPPHGENFLLRIAGDNAAKINGSVSVVLARGGVANEYLWDGICENAKVTRYGDMADREFDILARPSTAVVPGRVKGSNAGAALDIGPDDAAGPIVPRLAVPGSLVFMAGGKAPLSTTYKSKEASE